MQIVDKTLERTFISEVKDSQDETILLRGWVYKIIDLSNIVFVILRDKSGIIQLVTNKEQIESIIFDLTDSLGKKNISEALQVLKNLLYAKGPIQNIFITLYGHFKKLYITKIAINEN